MKKRERKKKNEKEKKRNRERKGREGYVLGSCRNEFDSPGCGGDDHENEGDTPTK